MTWNEFEGSEQNSKILLDTYIILYCVSIFSNDRTVLTDSFTFDKSCIQLLEKMVAVKNIVRS